MADAARSHLLIDVRPGDRLDLGGVSVEFLHKTGRAARVRVTAPRDVQVVKTTARERSTDEWLLEGAQIFEAAAGG